ncbi:hypothetical protein ACF0H5_004363 [Mactra antiquata]
MMLLGSAVWLVTVAFFWGATNPFIKRGSKGIETIQSSSPLKQFFAELWFLITTWQYLVPFIINQAGSVLYYITLASSDLTLAVPITNSLTFVFTAISGHILGERVKSKKTMFGMLLVIIGVTFCVLDRVT